MLIHAGNKGYKLSMFIAILALVLKIDDFEPGAADGQAPGTSHQAMTSAASHV